MNQWRLFFLIAVFIYFTLCWHAKNVKLSRAGRSFQAAKLRVLRLAQQDWVETGDWSSESGKSQLSAVKSPYVNCLELFDTPFISAHTEPKAPLGGRSSPTWQASSTGERSSAIGSEHSTPSASTGAPTHTWDIYVSQAPRSACLSPPHETD